MLFNRITEETVYKAIEIKLKFRTCRLYHTRRWIVKSTTLCWCIHHTTIPV